LQARERRRGQRQQTQQKHDGSAGLKEPVSENGRDGSQVSCGCELIARMICNQVSHGCCPSGTMVVFNNIPAR
jgi:hypothetical protein